jgi:hypothetical protein
LARRDQLTYDLGQPSRRPLPWLPLLLVVAVLGLAALLVQGALRSQRASPAAPQLGVVTSPTPTRASAPPPSPSGSDAQEGPGLPEGSRQAASRFVQAWLDRNPATRETALHQVSTPALAETLMLTDPANVPRASPRGAPVLEEAGTYSAQFRQPLSTGATVSIYLVADPAARYRWLATSVEQA